jgi:hypothetical protein
MPVWLGPVVIFRWSEYFCQWSTAAEALESSVTEVTRACGENTAPAQAAAAQQMRLAAEEVLDVVEKICLRVKSCDTS